MPLTRGKDNQGCWIRWGQQGKKYYYTCGNSQARKRARDKALAQARAIKANLCIHNSYPCPCTGLIKEKDYFEA